MHSEVNADASSGNAGIVKSPAVPADVSAVVVDFVFTSVASTQPKPTPSSSMTVASLGHASFASK
jgi:hypothetical protein